ncbi:MAG TPA: hypothetical protein VK209_02055 [Candidatus Sulfotelmatobacter sp.]|nr:hypothetical protein [Candidatus Sulfotelmatobacter sp.]
MTRDRLGIIIALILCLILTASLVSATINLSLVSNQKESEIRNLTSTINAQTSEINDLQTKIIDDNTTINSLNTQIANLQNQVTSINNELSSLTNQTTALQNQLKNLKEAANYSSPSQLQTLIFHVSEKGENYAWGHLPDASYTYNQILNLNANKYKAYLLPEYEGNNNWTATFAWLKQNFMHIPIVLSVFEGGSTNIPNTKLTIEQITQAVTALDIRELRIGEIISWYMSNLQPFPVDYVTSLLNFTRVHGLRLEWSEWETQYGAYARIQSYIRGYEDIVTVAFQTNSKNVEPQDGFSLTSGTFQHWGGSIQSWYWQERSYGSEFDMPTSILLQQTLLAKKLGAETLEFEPYWYLFDNGIAKQNLEILMTVLVAD